MRRHLLTGIAVTMLGCTPLAAQQAPAPTQPTPAQTAQPPDGAADLIRQAQQQMRRGNEEQAIKLAREAVQSFPTSFQANSQVGALLDLAGRYQEAREYLTKAVDLAPTPENKARAQRAIAISYGFDQNCAGATKYEEPLYRQYLDARDFYNAGEVANELARLCLDAGKMDEAYRWYHNGYEAGLREPDIKAERTDLWNYRWEHAQARIAARRGNRAEAQKHVDAAKALLERGNMPPQQKEYFPYLVGYVALHGGQYDTALVQLQQGNQSDPYVLGLIAQTYEKMGKQESATEYYRKVMAATIHNPTAAGSRPLARQKLGSVK
jgi:tetratricopeptide (TPR) repeat protein